ncbi:hypothetical protein EDD86DRAFT_198110 [Gorgonomyces haynaldii]|nr:hypothetical protein EDD86DRAFT_198110 [Gorgonomyces haynaldii]
MNYFKLADEFGECHKNHLNVIFHVFTTTGFYWALISLLNHSVGFQLTLGVVAVYWATIVMTASTSATVLTTLLVGSGFFVDQYVQPSVLIAGLFFAGCYLSQDLSHYLLGEPTFQQTYTPSASNKITWPSFFYKLFLHSYFMLPLVIETALRINVFEEILHWFLIVDRMVKVKLDSDQNKKDMQIIRDWLDEQVLPKDVTTHYWFAKLPKEINDAFARLAHDEKVLGGFNDFFPNPQYETIVWASMNEIYVATTDTTKATSDNVFYSNHLDGPWMCYPFASVYRAILALNPNDHIRTVFTAHPTSKILTDGDLWAFDFNREVHRIEKVKEASNQRYTLKLHYLVYPKALPFYGKILGYMTSIYDTIARLAFLKTLQPQGPLDYMLWLVIMTATRIFYGVIRAAGNSGAMSFVVASAVIMYFTKTDLPLFLISSSFIHYMIYISTYYFYETDHERIPFEAFKKTVMFYKGVAFYHLISNYILTLKSIDLISLGMIACGFGLSGAAAGAIGLDQTYFGVELRKVKPSARVTSFPYNLTAHPMIIGNIIGLFGFMKADGFREKLPWLVPVHVTLYTIHMLQEHFDIKKRAVLNKEE